MLLVRELVVGLDDRGRFGPHRVGVAFADHIVGVGVRVETVLGMEHHVSGKCTDDIAEDGQGLPFDDDRGGGGVGLFDGLGHDHAESVCFPAADVATRCRAPGVLQPEQHRLVEQSQAVLVDGDVGRCENAHHSVDGTRRVEIAADEPRMGLVGEDDLRPERVERDEIGGICGVAGHLGERISTEHRLSDSHHFTSMFSAAEAPADSVGVPCFAPFIAAAASTASMIL